MPQQLKRDFMHHLVCIPHKKHHHVLCIMLFSLLCIITLIGIVACTGSNPSTPAVPTAHTTTGTTKGNNGSAPTATSTSTIPLGPQPCPNVVSSTTYWDPII